MILIPQTSSPSTRNEWRSSECYRVCSCVRDSFATWFDGCTEARGVCASLSVVRNRVIKTIPLHTVRVGRISFLRRRGRACLSSAQVWKPGEGHQDGMKAGRAGRAGRGMASGNEWLTADKYLSWSGWVCGVHQHVEASLRVCRTERGGRKKPFLRSSDLASNPAVNHFALPPKQIQPQPLLQASTTPPRAASVGSPPSPPRSALLSREPLLYAQEEGDF